MRPGREEALFPSVDGSAESLKRPCSQESQIARLTKNHFIDRLEPSDPDNGVADRARDGLAVGHLKSQILLDNLDARQFQRGFRNPSIFQPSVHQNLGHGPCSSRLAEVYDFTFDIKDAHLEL